MSIDRCRGILFTHRYCVNMEYRNSSERGNYIAPGHHRTLDRKKYYMAYTESKNNQEEKDYEI